MFRKSIGKQSLILFAATFGFILFLGTISFATPMYYTFEGTIDTVQDHENFLSDQGFSVGSFVSYTIVIDDELAGYYTYISEGVRNYLPMESGYNQWAARYAAFISAPTLDTSNNPYIGDVMLNYVYLNSPQTGISTEVELGTNWNKFSLWQGEQLSLDEWYEGMEHVNFMQTTFLGTADAPITLHFGALNSLTLTNISETNPISNTAPEPSTILFFGFGLLALSGINRKRKIV